jgi:hypothetical protein
MSPFGVRGDIDLAGVRVVTCEQARYSLAGGCQAGPGDLLSEKTLLWA